MSVQARRRIVGMELSETGTENTVKWLSSNLPLKTAGLQLPNDYEKRRGYGLVTLYFNDVLVFLERERTTFLRRPKTRIHYLEDPKFRATNQVMAQVQRFRSGQVSMDSLSREKCRLEDFNPYSSPEDMIQEKLDAITRTIELVKSGTDLGKLYQSHLQEVSSSMLAEIRKTMPDVVVLARAWISHIRDPLSADYEFVDL